MTAKNYEDLKEFLIWARENDFPLTSLTVGAITLEFAPAERDFSSPPKEYPSEPISDEDMPFKSLSPIQKRLFRQIAKPA